MRPAARDQALDAIRRFHAEHGRLPQWDEWEHATADRPCARTIERRWGWQQLRAEAIGVDPAGLDVWEDRVDGRVNRMLAALIEARDKLGRWPFAEEWEQSGRKPSGRTFVRYFGSWAGACRAACRRVPCTARLVANDCIVRSDGAPDGGGGLLC